MTWGYCRDRKDWVLGLEIEIEILGVKPVYRFAKVSLLVRKKQTGCHHGSRFSEHSVRLTEYSFKGGSVY